MDRKMIIGYEPGERGRDALRLGRLFAGVTGARTIVARVLEWPSYLLPPDDLQGLVDIETREGFALARDELRGLEVETRALVDDSPAAALAGLAEEESAELIVVGSSHRGPVGGTVLGSVGESLVHGAPSAIAVAPHGYGSEERRGLLRIGIAFDGSPEAWTALEIAIGLARWTRGELKVVAVADYPRYGYATTWSVLTSGEIHDAEHDHKQRLLELALSKAPSGLSSEGRLLMGDAGRKLAEASSDFDLIIAGSRAYGPLRRTLLGSTTRHLLRASRCPVLVIPRGVGGELLGLSDREERAGSSADALS